MNINYSLKKIRRGRELQREKSARIKSVVALLSVLFIGIFIGNFFVPDINFSITGLASGELPTVGGDSGNWGTILNDYLSQEHTSTGEHKNVTISGNLSVTGTINSTDWTNVSITENQISDLHIWNSTNSSYRTLDNLTFDGNVNVTGNLNVTNNLTVNEDAKFEKNINITGNITISGDVGSGTPDANTLYAKSLPKAWVNFDGTSCSEGGTSGICSAESCTIKDSFNVDCVNRTGTEDFLIYFDRNFADANYASFGHCRSDSGATCVVMEKHDSPIRTTERMSIYTIHASSDILHDPPVVNMLFFGEQ